MRTSPPPPSSLWPFSSYLSLPSLIFRLKLWYQIKHYMRYILYSLELAGGHTGSDLKEKTDENERQIFLPLLFPPPLHFPSR